MNEIEMKNRTKQFALRILKMADAPQITRSGKTSVNQVARSITSIATNNVSTQIS